MLGGPTNPPTPALVAPSGVAGDGAGNVFLADPGPVTVYGFDSSGSQFLTINNVTNTPAPNFSFP